MTQFFVYILECSDQSYYVGFTDNLERRFSEHNSKKFSCSYTSSRLPLKLAWYQSYPSREEALASERKIKGWSRSKKELLIQNRFTLSPKSCIIREQSVPIAQVDRASDS